MSKALYKFCLIIIIVTKISHRSSQYINYSLEYVNKVTGNSVTCHIYVIVLSPVTTDSNTDSKPDNNATCCCK